MKTRALVVGSLMLCVAACTTEVPDDGAGTQAVALSATGQCQAYCSATLACAPWLFADEQGNVFVLEMGYYDKASCAQPGRGSSYWCSIPEEVNGMLDCLGHHPDHDTCARCYGYPAWYEPPGT